MDKKTIKLVAKPNIKSTALKKKKANQLIALTNKLKKTELHLIFIRFLVFF